MLDNIFASRQMSDQQPALPAPEEQAPEEQAIPEVGEVIQIRPPKRERQLAYDQHFPAEELPAEVHERRHTARIPIGFNYNPEDAEDIKQHTLKNLVSSRQARDIVRSANFMPGQFDIWNAKPTGGNNRYTGGSEDLDGDGIDEYVVRRDGKIVAVNGYTTKASDFPFKGAYYQTHPTPQRRKEQSYRKFLNDEYYAPEYNDDMSEITAWGGEDPTTEEFRRKYKKHTTHAPTKFSPYRAFAQLIVAPACRAAFRLIANNNEEKAKLARKIAIDLSGKKAYEASMASKFYDTNVKIPFLNSIANQLPALRQDFASMKRRSNSEYVVDWTDGSLCSKQFEQWLFNKAAVKERIKAYVHNMLSEQREHYINEVKNKIAVSLRRADNFDTRLRNEWAQKQEAIRNRFA